MYRCNGGQSFYLRAARVDATDLLTPPPPPINTPTHSTSCCTNKQTNIHTYSHIHTCSCMYVPRHVLHGQMSGTCNPFCSPIPPAMPINTSTVAPPILLRVVQTHIHTNIHTYSTQTHTFTEISRRRSLLFVAILVTSLSAVLQQCPWQRGTGRGRNCT